MSEHVPCPSCESDDVWEVYRHPHRPIAHGVCRSCGLGYLSPRPTSAEIDSLYAHYRQAYPDEALASPSGPFDSVGRARATFVSTCLGPAARLLEVGCGYGHFVKASRELGLRARGIDPSAHQIDFARSRLAVDVSLGSIDSLSESGSWDGIAMFHVLEHLREPAAALRRVARALRPGGHAIIEVPHALRLPVDAIEHFYVASGQHLSTFSPRALSDMAIAAGLEPILLEHSPLPAVYHANLRMVARRSGKRTARPEPRPRETLRALREHRDGLEALRDRIRRQIAAWRGTGRRIAIYGAGFHTLGVLDLCGLSAREIALVVDDDATKHGTRIEGIPVAEAAAITSESIGAVLISSLASEATIAASLTPLSRAGIAITGLYGPTGLQRDAASAQEWEGAQA